MVNLLNSKKAMNDNNIIFPLVFVFVIAFIFIISALIGVQVIDGFRTAYATTPGLEKYNSEEAQNIMDNFEKPYFVLDKILAAFTVGLIIGIGFTSYRINTRPAFYIVTIVIGIVYCFFGYLFSFIFIKFIEQPSIVFIMKYFSLTTMICTNLHWLGLILIVVGSIALYGKKPTETVPLR